MRLPSHRRALRAFLLSTAALVCVAAGFAFAQTTGQPGVVLVEPAAPLLPKQFGAWQQNVADPGADSNAAPGAGAKLVEESALQTILKEDGLTRSAAETYTRAGSTETVDLKAYQFIDATGAFSAFTYFRRPEDRAIGTDQAANRDPHPAVSLVANLGTAAVQHGDSVLIWNGPSVVLVSFHGGRRVAELADLVAGLPKLGGPKGDPPLLPTFLPTNGLESGTVKYALGPEGYHAMGGVLPASLIGFDKSAEVVTAKYAGRGSLTLLLYPTPQIAGDRGRAIETEMNREGTAAGTVKLRREGELVLLTTGAWAAADALRTIDDIHLRTQLTWNKPIQPEFHAEVRKTASLLVSILELSGLLMLAAIVLGLFFGGGRAAIRVLQGKPAATEPEFLRIDLRDRPGEASSIKQLH